MTVKISFFYCDWVAPFSFVRPTQIVCLVILGWGPANFVKNAIFLWLLAATLGRGLNCIGDRKWVRGRPEIEKLTPLEDWLRYKIKWTLGLQSTQIVIDWGQLVIAPQNNHLPPFIFLVQSSELLLQLVFAADNALLGEKKAVSTLSILCSKVGRIRLPESHHILKCCSCKR